MTKPLHILLLIALLAGGAGCVTVPPKPRTFQQAVLEAIHTDHKDHPVVIVIDKTGVITLAGRPTSLDELKGIRNVDDFPEHPATHIRAHPKTKHTDIKAVIDTLANVNIWKISFAVIKDPVFLALLAGGTIKDNPEQEVRGVKRLLRNVTRIRVREGLGRYGGEGHKTHFEVNDKKQIQEFVERIAIDTSKDIWIGRCNHALPDLQVEMYQGKKLKCVFSFPSIFTLRCSVVWSWDYNMTSDFRGWVFSWLSEHGQNDHLLRLQENEQREHDAALNPPSDIENDDSNISYEDPFRKK